MASINRAHLLFVGPVHVAQHPDVAAVYPQLGCIFLVQFYIYLAIHHAYNIVGCNNLADAHGSGASGLWV
jgi:hypothetical protein